MVKNVFRNRNLQSKNYNTEEEQIRRFKNARALVDFINLTGHLIAIGIETGSYCQNSALKTNQSVRSTFQTQFNS